MKSLTKLLCLLLAGVMLLGMLASCNKDKGDGEGDTTASNNGDEGNGLVFDENGYLMDSLPETYDWNTNYTIYSWSNMQAWEWCPELTNKASAVDRTLWERQNHVEERFGVTLKFVFERGEWDNRNKFIEKLSASVMLNQGTYDLVDQAVVAAGIGAVQELYVDLNDMNYLDLTKPWWPATINETAAVGPNLYFVTGDVTATFIRNVNCASVNLDMYDSYNIKDLANGKSIFQLVDDYEWTIGKMYELGLGKVNTENGEYGIALKNNVTADLFFYGAGFRCVRAVDGEMSMSDDLSSPILMDFFDKVQELYAGRYPDAGITGIDVFKQKKALFYMGGLADCSQFTEEGVNFTVVPAPLLNEDSQSYHSIHNTYLSMFSIPKDGKDMDMSAMILEALGSYGYRVVTDEIYYDLFQYRYNGVNQDTARMFDLVSDSTTYDVARLFVDDIGMFSDFRNTVNDPAGNWNTVYNQEKEGWENGLEYLKLKIGK